MFNLKFFYQSIITDNEIMINGYCSSYKINKQLNCFELILA